jgi:predicted HicB family RNase H-like nuclease
MPQTVVQFQIRMPPMLHDKVAGLALKNGESMNVLIVRFLTEAVEAREKPSAIPKVEP